LKPPQQTQLVIGRKMEGKFRNRTRLTAGYQSMN